MAHRPTNWIEPILHRYERPLLQYAASLCPPGELARDIVQDTFVRLAQHGPLEADHLAPWLFTVCRNRAHDLRRKEARMHPPTPPGPLPDPHHHDTPSHALEQKETHARLLSLLEALPPAQREVLRLRFQGDLSYREIAEITELGVSHVGVLIHNGLRKLRQLWSDEPQKVTP